MALRLLQGQTINGIWYQAFDVVVGLSAEQEAQLMAGGGATAAAVAVLTDVQGRGLIEILESAGYSDASRVMPVRGGVIAPAIQFRGATDTTAAIGALGLTINAPNNSAAAALLQGSAPDVISPINGASPAGIWHRAQFGAAVTVVHIGQMGMAGTYAVNDTGPVLAASVQFTRLEFDAGDNVRTLLWYEGPPTNFAGTPGTGSARMVNLLGITAVI